MQLPRPSDPVVLLHSQLGQWRKRWPNRLLSIASILLGGVVLLTDAAPAKAVTALQTTAFGTVTDGFRPLYREGGTTDTDGSSTLVDGGPWGIAATATASSGEARASSSVDSTVLNYRSSGSAQAEWLDSFNVAGPDGEEGLLTLTYSLSASLSNSKGAVNYSLNVLGAASQVTDTFFGNLSEGGSQDLSGTVVYRFDYNRDFQIRGFVQTFNDLHSDDGVESSRAEVTLRATSSLGTVNPPPPPPVGPEIIYAGPTASIGEFNEATNWNPQQVPQKTDTRSDTAIFSLGEVYTVNVGTASTERALFNGGPAANVIFTNANYTIATTDPDNPGLVINGGKLTLQSGTINAIHAIVGQSAASEMEVSSDLFGVGRLNVTGSLQIGGAGEGEFKISLGGQVTSGEARIGPGEALGQAYVVGAGSMWQSGSMTVEHVLGISDGGKVSSGEVRIGGTLGFVSVTGMGSRWSTGNLTVGYEGSFAALVVKDGAEVASGAVTVGRTGDRADVILSSGGVFRTGLFRMGEGSNSLLEINQGSEMISEAANIAAGTGFTANVDVAGTWRIKNEDGLILHNANVRVHDGGILALLTDGLGGGYLTINASTGMEASVILEGGSYTGGDVTVGSNGHGAATFEVSGGGSAIFPVLLVYGQDDEMQGIAQVIGYNPTTLARSYVFTGEIFIVGGELKVIDGATIDGSYFSIGELASGGGAYIGGTGGGHVATLTVRGDTGLASDGNLVVVKGVLSVGHGIVDVAHDMKVASDVHDAFVTSESSSLFNIRRDLIIGTNGRVSGEGLFNVAGNVYQNGTVSPGSSPGLLTFNANYISGMTALLEMEIAGLLPGLEHDQILITGDAFLAGKLRISFIDGFQPGEGDVFQLLDIRGITTGQFDQVEVIGLAGGLAAIYNPRTGAIEVNQSSAAPTPEPATVLLWSLAMLGLTRRSYRSRSGAAVACQEPLLNHVLS